MIQTRDRRDHFPVMLRRADLKGELDRLFGADDVSLYAARGATPFNSHSVSVHSAESTDDLLGLRRDRLGGLDGESRSTCTS